MSNSTAAEYEGRDLEVLAKLPNYYDWIVDTFRPWLKGHTMEIGAGVGTIARRIVDEVDHLDLVEPSVNLPELSQRGLTDNPKVAIISETLEQRLPQMTDESCDTIVMVNVLEHIEDDSAALKELNRILKPGGCLLLFVPAIKILYSELDRQHGHYRRYHLTPLKRLVQDCGFNLLRHSYFDMAGVLPWWLINTVGKRTTFNPAVSRIYDKYAIPATRYLEKWLPPPFGKNIILVAERPSVYGDTCR